MKFLFVLLVFIFTIINLSSCISDPIPTPSPSTQYLISIKNYQYDVVGCATHESSDHHSGNSGMSGSSSSFEINSNDFSDNKNEQLFDIGTIDGGGGPSGSESSVESLCDNSVLVRETYVVLDQCVTIDYVSYIFSIMYNNGTIRITDYSDQNCSISGNRVTYVKPFDCLDNCKTVPQLYTIIEASEIEIPSDTVVFVTFFGNCEGSWKKDFTVIDYHLLNTCITTSTRGSESYACNSTKLLTSYSYKYDCDDYEDQVYTDVGNTECYGYYRDENQRTICNDSM